MPVPENIASAPPIASDDPTPASTVAAGVGTPGPHDTARRRTGIRLALVLLLALCVCLGVYLAYTIPNAWFPGVATRTFGTRDLVLTRGSGQVVDGALTIDAPDATGLTLVSLVSNLQSTDYAAIAWLTRDLPEGADVRLLWRTDYAPEKINAAAVPVEAGRALPVVLATNPDWIGRVTGLALAVRGPLPQPIHVSGVVAKPMGALEILRDRAREWFTFEGWTGASINTVTGGAEVQDLPLPLLLACAVALAAAAAALIERWRPGTFGVRIPIIAGSFFLIGWLLLDARWTTNLVRQEKHTATQYAGKDWQGKHLAAEDGPLFAFIERALKVLPATPVRIFVAADADYFRGRAAYHLYPHSVFDPRNNQLQPASLFRPGDWFLVYQRRGIQYDPSRQMLRWDGNQTVHAELKLTGPGAALFLIR